jgi:DNA mismatch endonuclease (patch repair protein)
VSSSRSSTALSAASDPTRAGRRILVSPGRSLPYPEPANAAASAFARGNVKRDTRPEVAVRSALHTRGFRFRKEVRIAAGLLRVRVDVVFSRARVAAFVDGCFWHGCPLHQRVPKRNNEYWASKLLANVARDRRVDHALAAEGWKVVRVWEHEDPHCAAEAIAGAVRGASSSTIGRR